MLAGIVTLLLVVLAVAWHDHRRAKDAEQLLANAKQKGYPINADALLLWHRPTQAEQAARLGYWLAFAAITDPVNRIEAAAAADRRLVMRVTEPMTASDRALMSIALARNGAALRMLHEAAKAHSARFALTSGRGGISADVGFFSIREAALLLGMEATMSAERGDTNRTLDSLAAMLALAHALDRVPTRTAFMMRRMILTEAVGHLGRVLSRVDGDDEQLGVLADRLRAADNAKPLVCAMAGERVLGCMRLGYLAGGGMNDGRASGSPARCVDMEAVIALLKADRRLIELAESGSGHDVWIAAAQEKSCGGMRALLVEEVFIAVRVRLARLAVAAKRYRLAHGALPSSLEIVGGDQLLDPATDDPFDYRIASDCWTVASRSGRKPVSVAIAVMRRRH